MTREIVVNQTRIVPLLTLAFPALLHRTASVLSRTTQTGSPRYPVRDIDAMVGYTARNAVISSRLRSRLRIA